MIQQFNVSTWYNFTSLINLSVIWGETSVGHPVIALCGICSQCFHQLVCSNFSARQSQHLASLVSKLPVFGVLVYLLKHTLCICTNKLGYPLTLFIFFFFLCRSWTLHCLEMILTVDSRKTWYSTVWHTYILSQWMSTYCGDSMDQLSCISTTVESPKKLPKCSHLAWRA